MRHKHYLFLALVEVMALVMFSEQDCFWQKYTLRSTKLLGVAFIIMFW